MVRGIAVVAVVLAAVCAAQLAWATPEPGSYQAACAVFDTASPELEESRLRWAAAREEVAAHQARWLWELRGSYFYYPEGSLDGEGLRDTSQRADVYARYPLIGRLRDYEQRLEELELQAQRVEAEYRENVRRARSELLRQYRVFTRCQVTGRVLGRVVETEQVRLEELRQRWQDKLELFDTVLGQQLELERLRLRAVRNEAVRQTAAGEIRALLGDSTWEPVPLSLDPLVLPEGIDPLQLGPATAGAASDARAALEEARAERWAGDVRLDLETGYTWEVDRRDDLSSGARLGVRFAMPLVFGAGARRAQAAYRANGAAWRARARAARERQLGQRVEELKTVSALVQEQCVLAVRRAQLDEQERVATLQGVPVDLQTKRAALALDEWGLYFDALEASHALYPDGLPQGAAEKGHVFPPPEPVSEATLRKGPARSAYVWGGLPVVGRSAAAVLEFVQAKGIDRLLVSPGAASLQSEAPAWAALLDAARSAGIEVWLLLGENRWVQAGQRSGLADRLEQFVRFQEHAAGERFGGVHLDVEPQTFETWPQDAARLIDDYTRMLAFARERLGAISKTPVAACLSVGLVNRLTPEQARGIGSHLDEVAIMGYTPVPIEHIREAAAVFATQNVALTIVLRAQDWPTEGALERRIHSLLPAVPRCERIGVQDLEAWWRLAGKLGGQGS